jgi:hypothetical protein
MCARLGVGVQFSAPYAHRMLERPWRTIRDNASARTRSIDTSGQRRKGAGAD